ncbi:carbon storage regulator [Candidatus Binatia bacterium]|jgi:carbon storage regulator|nr:carbon storage regulator [Candidatus Binatia bacterium]
MLILTRKIGEMIRIGDEVTVRVLAVRGAQVSLGFEAPSEVRIFREEVLRDERPSPEPVAASVREPMHGERDVTAKPPAKLRGRPAPRKLASRSA